MNLGSSATLTEIIPTLIATGFYTEATADLRTVLAAEPDNTQAWRGLVRVCRANGDLAAARQACERFMALRPDDSQIIFTLAVLAGRNLPAAPPQDERYVCPFVRVEDFLTDAEHASLIDVASSQPADTMPSKVRAGEYQPEIRQSKLVPPAETLEVARWFTPRIRHLLPAILPRLSSDGMDAGRIELQMTVHNDGDFYNIHRDDHERDEQVRRVSYVYYFHQQPKRFTGGDLLLYDSDLVNHECHTGFTRLEPLDNSIVFFPSAYFHQVTPIRCETRLYRHGRFTVNGWIHAQGTGDRTPDV